MPGPSSPCRRRLFASLAALALASVASPGSVSAAPRRAGSAPPDGPNVTYTGFRMLPDGRSLLFVELTGKVPVSEQRQGRTVTYLLEGAHVAARNNRNPLLTAGFATVLESARWRVPKRKQGKGAGGKSRGEAARALALVLTLRQPVEPSYSVRETSSGAVLEIMLPALTAK